MRIRERKGPSQGVIQRHSLHERSFFAPKFETGLKTKTLNQERCARSDAWEIGQRHSQAQRKGQSNILLAFGCLVFTSAILNKPQERYFVVDSGASRHNRKDLNSNELETVRVSRNPTTVITANGEMQTNEEAAVYVNDWDLIRDSPDPRGYARRSIA